MKDGHDFNARMIHSILPLVFLGTLASCHVHGEGTGAPAPTNDEEVIPAHVDSGSPRPKDSRSMPKDAAEPFAPDGPAPDVEDRPEGDSAPDGAMASGADRSVDLFPPVPDKLPPGVALEKGLLLYLRLDDGPGSIMARDQSGQKNSVLVRDSNFQSAWVAGRFDGAFQPGPGRDAGWLRAESSNNLNSISSGFTIGAWVYRPAGVDGVLLSRRASGAGGFLYILEVTDGHPRVRIHSKNGYHADLPCQASIPEDRWIHVGATYDQHDVKVFVDGRLVGTMPFLLVIGPDYSPVVIGASQNTMADTAADHFAGPLDEVVLYGRALSSDEMGALAVGFRPLTR